MLLLKHLDKFYNKVEVPWVQLIWSSYYQNKVPHLTPPKGSFRWKDILKLQDTFRDIAHCYFGKGDTIGLWMDNFMDQPWSSSFDNLHSYAKVTTISMQKALQTVDILELFRLPMSRVAYNEFLEFKDVLLSLQVQDPPNDT